MTGQSTSGGYAARTIPNIIAVARREFMSRARTRTFRLTTVLLVVAGTALALAPILFQWLEGESSGDRVEVIVGDAAPSVDVVTALGQILNSASGPSIPVGGQDTAPKFRVVAATDVAAARADVLGGSSIAALALDRATDAAADLTFDLYSKDSALNRKVQLIRQAAISIAIQDRLTRAGVSPVDQAHLFTPPSFNVLPADPNAKPGLNPNEDPTAFLVGFGLSIAIFMAIILYGQWIAYSVAEEKNSRVMEIVLAAATPFQLLAGKVVGVGGLAILQYFIVAIPMILAVVFQGQIAALILGGAAGAGSGAITAGLQFSTIAAFGVLFVLGFAIYACLYAGAASLVSRQEEINQIVAPLTFVSVAGYLVATYAGTGLIPIDSPIVVILSFVPLFSPYLMLTRLSLGTAGPLDFAIAVVLLLLAIPAVLWFAARLYRSGVLMYGQSPTPRTLWKALRAR
ncbi:MAG TPA: ABC transporter permease [Patescibacteria group bacterium]|nr:ABC transporter permease [Patescibacteria group bacterium]